MNLTSPSLLTLGFAAVLTTCCLSGCNSGDPDSPGKEDEPVEGPVAEIVGQDLHNFGTANINSTGSHRFELKNVGTRPLIVTHKDVDGGYGTGRVEGSPIAPGESGYLVAEWKIMEFRDDYLQEIVFETNDPAQETLSVKVMGRVPPPVMPSIARIGIRNANASEGFERYFDIHAFTSEDLQILGHSWLSPETDEFMEVSFEPLPPGQTSERAQTPVLAAVRVKLKAKAGMPSGMLMETISVKTNLSPERDVQVTLLADVRGAFVIVPTKDLKFDREKNVLDLGRTNRLSTKTHEIQIVARLSELSQESVALELSKAEPSDVMFVDVGQAKEVGKTLMFPVTISLQGAGQTVSRLGPTPDLLGRIEIKTTDPQHPKIDFLVKFALTQ